jgi:hypothetical protein
MEHLGRKRRGGVSMLERMDAAIALTDCEAQELQACEAIIARGVNTFIEVGTALLAIRDQRLYRATHGTFEAYCRERWNVGHSHAQRMIDAARVAENLSPIGDTLKPSHESQLRPLTSLQPGEQRSAWTQAIAESNGKQPTGAKVKEVVRVHAGQADPIIDPSTFSKTMREKFAAAIRQARREIEQQVRAEEKARIQKWLEETRLPMFEKRWREVVYLLETKKGFMSKAEYHKVIKCLHTDTRQHVSNAEANEAFNIFKKLEIVLVAEAKPTDSAFADHAAVTSWAQVEEIKRKVREDRKRQREDRRHQ